MSVCNHRLEGVTYLGDTAGPASLNHGSVEWKLVTVDMDVAKFLYSLLPKP